MIAADILGIVTPVIDAVVDAFGVAQGWLFQTVVNPSCITWALANSRKKRSRARSGC